MEIYADAPISSGLATNYIILIDDFCIRFMHGIIWSVRDHRDQYIIEHYGKYPIDKSDLPTPYCFNEIIKYIFTRDIYNEG